MIEYLIEFLDGRPDKKIKCKTLHLEDGFFMFYSEGNMEYVNAEIVAILTGGKNDS